MKPKVPEIKPAKTPVKPTEAPTNVKVAQRPKGLSSLISAGVLTRRPTTRKSTLLGV